MSKHHNERKETKMVLKAFDLLHSSKPVFNMSYFSTEAINCKHISWKYDSGNIVVKNEKYPGVEYWIPKSSVSWMMFEDNT